MQPETRRPQFESHQVKQIQDLRQEKEPDGTEVLVYLLVAFCGTRIEMRCAPGTKPVSPGQWVDVVPNDDGTLDLYDSDKKGE